MIKELKEKQRAENYDYEIKLKKSNDKNRDLSKLLEECNDKWTKKYNSKVEELKDYTLEHLAEKDKFATTISNLKALMSRSEI